MFIDGKAFSGKEFQNKIAKEKFAIFLLWMISKKEQHGYEMLKTLKEDAHLPSITASKIYPLLKYLLGKGLITQKKVMHGKRAKKVYSITAKGKEVLKKAKEHVKKSPLVRQYAEDLLK